MTKRKLDRNPNRGKRHPHSWDERRNANYANSNLRRIAPNENPYALSVSVDPSRKGTARKAYDEFVGTNTNPDYAVFG